jgi:hypothetical protein
MQGVAQTAETQRKERRKCGRFWCLDPRTMTVTITAKTASEYAASRCAVCFSSRIEVPEEEHGEERH